MILLTPAERIRSQLEGLIGTPMRRGYREHIAYILESEGLRPEDYLIEVQYDTINIHPVTNKAKNLFLGLEVTDVY